MIIFWEISLESSVLKNGGKNNVKINRCLWGIKEYYDYISKEELKLESNAMFGERMDL